MATKTHNDNHLYVAFLVTFLAGMAFMAIIFMAKGQGLRSKAYSEYWGGGFAGFGQEKNCPHPENPFDARHNGSQVAACLGIPGPAQNDLAPVQVE